jgi:long-subunit fatty acid transport protein
MKKILIFNFILSIALLNLVLAGDVAKIGTVSGTELLIPVGAKSISLGGSVVSNVKGAEAIHWNPAGMAYSQKSEILFSTMQYIADINVNYIAGVFNGGNIGSFGLHIKSLAFGDIEETTTDQPDGTGRTYSPNYTTLGLSYGRLLTDRITAGVTAKYVYEGIMQTTASTFAFDMGVQYSFNQNLRMGVTLMNLGGKLSFNGRNLETPSQIPGAPPTADNGYFRAVPLASNIPSTFSFGFSYRSTITESNSLELNGAFTNFNESTDQLYGGLEYSLNDMFFLRGGYQYNMQEIDEQLFDFSVGAGLKYSVGRFDVIIDYAYRNVSEFFDNSNIFSIIFAL